MLRPTRFREKSRSVRIRVMVGAVALIALGVFWWGFPKPLSATERRMVGNWNHRDDPIPEAPQGSTRVWAFATDRSCRIQVIDTASGRILDEMAGRWSASEEALICDWERKLNGSGLDKYRIDSLSDDEVVLRPRGGPEQYDLQREARR